MSAAGKQEKAAEATAEELARITNIKYAEPAPVSILPRPPPPERPSPHTVEWFLAVDPGPCNQGQVYGALWHDDRNKQKVFYIDEARTHTVHYLAEADEAKQRMHSLRMIAAGLRHDFLKRDDLSRALVVIENQYFKTGRKRGQKEGPPPAVSMDLIRWQERFQSYLYGYYVPREIACEESAAVARGLKLPPGADAKGAKEKLAFAELCPEWPQTLRSQHVADALVTLFYHLAHKRFAAERQTCTWRFVWGLPEELRNF